MKLGFFDRRLIRHFDWMLLGTGLLIPIFGLIVLYSAGYDPDTLAASIFSIPIRSQVFFKQSIFFLVGVGLLLIVLSIPPSVLNRWAYAFYGACVFLLVVVAIFGLVKKGSQRWIPLGFGFNLQPSELMKVGMILCLGRYLSRHPPKGKPLTFTQLIVPGLIVGIPMLIIAEQPDLGSALAVGGIGALMILFVGVQPRILVSLLILFAAAAPLAWTQLLHDYQKRRVWTLLDPESDPRGSGYHIKQSIIAVGSGELTGKGFMEGTQTQLEFLPEHSTDFIFSVLAEEWGFLGTLTVVSLYATLLYRLLRVVNRSRDLFTAFIAFGVVAAFSVTSIINIGMVIGLLPVVGIPLPLFSYGGSAMLSMLAILGLALGVSMRRHTFA